MSTASQSRFRGTLAPLGNIDFRNLLISNTLWWQAMWMEMIVVGWLVLELTNSAFDVALVGFCRSSPLLITGFFSGPISARFGRIRVVLISQGISLMGLGIITALVYFDAIAYWHLATAAVFFGTSWAFSWTARRALIPDLIGKSQTVEAMMLESFTQNISRVLGPFASGSLIATLGSKGCYIAVISVSCISFFIMLFVHGPPHVRQPSTASPWKLMTEGVSYAIGNQAILGDLLITVTMNFLAFPYMALLPVFARDILQQGPFELGLLGASNGLGAFIGLFIVNRVRQRFSRGWIFAVGSAFQAANLVFFSYVSTLPLSMVFFGTSIPVAFPLSLGLLLLAGTGQAAFGVMQSAIVLLAARDDMRDRAMGTLVLAIGAGPFGQLQIGKLAESFGAPLALGCQTSAAVVFIVLITAALPRFRAKLESP